MNPTKQEVFNVAWNGLKAQGFVRSERDGEPCGRDDRGNRCARLHVAMTFNENTAQLIGWDLTRRLQRCHDESTSPADMERRLREFAKAEGLTVPGEPDAFQAFMAKVHEPVISELEGAIERVLIASDKLFTP